MNQHVHFEQTFRQSIEQMNRLASAAPLNPKSNQSVSKKGLEDLHGAIYGIFGPLQAHAFTKICAHAKTTDALTVSTAVMALMQTQWTYENALIRLTAAPHQRKNIRPYHDFNGFMIGHKTVRETLPSNPAGLFDRGVDMKFMDAPLYEFIRGHFDELSLSQRQKLKPDQTIAKRRLDYTQ